MSPVPVKRRLGRLRGRKLDFSAIPGPKRGAEKDSEASAMEPPSKRHRQEGTPILNAHPHSPADSTPTLATCAHKEPKAGAVTLQRIQSVERGLCSQTLDTPAQPLALSSEELVAGALFKGSDCGFSISYSQNYRRLPSLDPERAKPQEEQNEGAGPSSWESETVNFAELDENRRDPQTTPELSAQPGNSTTPETRKFFPLFRPKSEWKTIHIIRHGESEYNAATTSKELGFADPQIYDPKLTARGRRQATNLRSLIDDMKISKDALWVVSPLSRALETMMLACPHSARVGSSTSPLNVVVHKDISEQCQTTGDIGLPTSVMCKKFPQFKDAMKDVPERWWFRQDANDAESKRFFKPETTKQMRVRVGEFRKWVQNRPEKVIVAFGHNCLFKELTNGQKSLRNCEVHSMAI